MRRQIITKIIPYDDVNVKHNIVRIYILLEQNNIHLIYSFISQITYDQ